MVGWGALRTAYGTLLKESFDNNVGRGDPLSMGSLLGLGHQRSCI